MEIDGLQETVKLEELMQRKEYSGLAQQLKHIKDTMVRRFKSINEANKFGEEFVNGYLASKYDWGEMEHYPLRIIEPHKSVMDFVDEMRGVKRVPHEAWLIIDIEKCGDMEDYMKDA